MLADPIRSLSTMPDLLTHSCVQAVATRYATGPGASDPMVELAKVHLQRRGWLDGKTDL